MVKTISMLISIFLFLINSSCCTFYNFKQPHTKETPIKLEILDSVVTENKPIAKLKVYLTNNSNSTIAVIPVFHRDWHPIVLFKDSIRYDYQILIKLHAPSKSDYIEIEPFTEINLSFDLNISEYAREMFRGNNVDYGNYKIEIVYEDKFLESCNAISGPIYSNKINLVYNKN